MSSHAARQLEWALATIASHTLSRARLHAAVQASDAASSEALATVCQALGLAAPQRLSQPEPANLPFIAHLPGFGWGVVIHRDPDGQWKFSQEDVTQRADGALLAGRSFRVDALEAGGQGSFAQLIRTGLRRHRGALAEVLVASGAINLLAMTASMFSMQVYDRVIPTRGDQTLIVLAAGVALVIAIELALRLARGTVVEAIGRDLDSQWSRDIFERLLEVRIDRLPGAVGTLAGQLRGYEQVRAFLTASTLFALIDLPMAVAFIGLMAILGSVWVALVPAICAACALALGMTMRRRVQALAAIGADTANRKTGLLVEALEGAETIKAGNGAWKFLARWIDSTSRNIDTELATRKATETLTSLSGALQQLSYAAVVSAGAFFVMRGDMTTGALIACSILGGRVLQPVLAIPSLLVQHSHAMAAVRALEGLYALPTDHEGVGQPLTPSRLQGYYLVEGARFAYPQGSLALAVERLEIRAGERICVLGPIGSGKSTLLRLLAGLYQPQQGRVLLDGMDLRQVHRQSLAQHIGYLQQDHRLFQGTLRENLLLGIPDPGDDALHRMMVRTGLIHTVAGHPRGLDLPIFEGGKGLSGGQRQLVAFTRVLLGRPCIALLDEPTAAMDGTQAARCLATLREDFGTDTTLVVVSHRPELLQLVDRVIVVIGSQVVRDGPRDQVLAQMPRHAGMKVVSTSGVDAASSATLGSTV